MNTDTLELEKNLGEESASEFPRVIRRDLPGFPSANHRKWLGNG